MLNDLIKELKEKDLSCLVFKNNKIVFTSKEKGIKPIVNILKSNKEILEDGIVVDKIIGKATALLIVYGKVKKCYGEIISEEGALILEKNKIPFEFGKKVKNISNRLGTDICPMEKMVQNIESPTEAYKVLSNFLMKL